MDLELWPSENCTESKSDQCKLNMELTWKYSVLPYIKNALTFEAGIDKHINAKLNEFWEEFISIVFKPQLSDDENDNSFLS